MLAHVQDAVVCLDTNLQVVYWNDTAERLFQWPRAEILGCSVLQRLPAETHDAVAGIMNEVLAQKVVMAREWEDYRRDGSRLWVCWRAQPLIDDAGRVVGVVSIGTDVTARRSAEARLTELEAQLLQAQKMETMGLLASGIAHDFNNLLTTILMSSAVGLGDPFATPTSLAALRDIRSSGLRAKDLVKRVLNFSRREVPDRKLVDLGKLVTEVVALMRVSLARCIAVRHDLASDCPRVLADENRLHQVFVNLASNAAAAMRQGGVLGLQLRQVQLAEARRLAVGVLEPGSYLAVAVADTGTGMDEAVLQRIFEPFYTTKAAGEGSGLGLTIVASVVEGHGGGVDVSSAPGAGSTFTVYLPVVAAPTLVQERHVG